MGGCDLYMVEGNQRAPWGPFYIKALFPSMRTLPSTSNHLLKVLPPNTLTLGVSVPVYEFGANTNIQTTALLKKKKKKKKTRTDKN